MTHWHDKYANKTHSWDDSNGLGWQLWRCAHFTGLLSGKNNKKLRSLHSRTLVARSSLLADIHGRWGLDKNRAVPRYSQSFPLVIARFPLFYPHKPYKNSSFSSYPQSRFINEYSPSSQSGRSDLLETSWLSKEMTVIHTLQRAKAMDTDIVRHGGDMLIPGQKVGLPLELKEFENPGETTATISYGSYDGESSRLETIKKAYRRSSAKPAYQRSVQATDAINAKSEFLAPELKADSLLDQCGKPDRSLFLQKYMPFLQTPLPKSQWRYDDQLLQSYRKVDLLYDTIPWRHMLMSHSINQSQIEDAETDTDKDFSLLRPKYWSTSRFNPLPPIHPTVATEEATRFRRIALKKNTSGKSTVHPSVTIRPLTLKAQLQLRSDRNASFFRGGDGIGKSICRVLALGSALPITPFRQRFSSQHPSFTQSQIREYARRFLPSVRLPSMNPAVVTKGATRFRRIALKEIASGKSIVYPSVTIRPVTSKTLLQRRSDRNASFFRGGNGVGKNIGRVLAFGHASTAMSFAQQSHHKKAGLNHVSYKTDWVAGKGWVLPTGKYIDEDGSTLLQHRYNSDAVIRRFYSGSDAGAGDEGRDSKGSIGITSLIQSHCGRGTSFPPFENSTMAVIGDLLSVTRELPIRNLAPRTTADAIRFPTLALKIVPRNSVSHDKRREKEEPSCVIQKPGISFHRFDRGKFVTNWTDSQTGIVRRKILPGLTRTILDGVEMGHSVFRNSVDKLTAPLTLPTLGIGWDEQVPATFMGKVTHEMPLFHPRGTEGRSSSNSNHHISHGVVQTSLQLPESANTDATAMLTIGANQKTAISESQTPAKRTQIDPDELVEKVWKKIMRKLTIEQERRGCTLWI